jgi:hypothetical protein
MSRVCTKEKWYALLVDIRIYIRMTENTYICRVGYYVSIAKKASHSAAIGGYQSRKS